MSYLSNLKKQVQAVRDSAPAGAKLAELRIPAELMEHLKRECGDKDPSEVVGVELVVDSSLDVH